MNHTIIGKHLDAYFLGSEEEARKVYVHPKYVWQIWEVEDSMYGYMCNQSEEEFLDQAGEDAFWRGSHGTVLGKPCTPCMIHGKELNVWDDFDEEDLPPYKTLLDYLAHIGISNERNLIAAFNDLAKWNDITVKELLNTYEEQCNEE